LSVVFIFTIVGFLPRQTIGKPAVPRKIYVEVTHAIGTDLDTFLAQRFGLPLGTPRTPADISTMEF
jgi:hypothetical protein